MVKNINPQNCPIDYIYEVSAYCITPHTASQIYSQYYKSKKRLSCEGLSSIKYKNFTVIRIIELIENGKES